MIKRLYFSILCVISLLFVGCSSSQSQTEGSEKQDTPLNISVFIDLSDRLTRDLTPSQFYRDTAIINNIVDLFIKDCITRGKIINSRNHFQVFFYPFPENTHIDVLAKGLNYDLSQIKIKDKRLKLSTMKSEIQTNIGKIYTDALNDKKWVGCDIWGFFSNKKVDELCIRDGYRNMVIILTDGYLYHKDNKIQDHKEYSYVTSRTLNIDGSSLIVKRAGLDNLEVLMLEVNPYKGQRDKLIQVLNQWFNSMGVATFAVAETDLPNNTKTIIESFINN